MSFLKFVSGILGHISSSNVREEAIRVQQTLNDTTLTSLESAAESFSNHRMASKEGVAFERDLRKVSTKFRGNAFVLMRELVQRGADTFAAIVALSGGERSGDYVSSAMTYREASVLRLLELSDFCFRYSRLQLRVLIHYELMSIRTNVRVYDGVTKDELLWLEKYRSDYIKVLSFMQLGAKEMLRKVNDIPDLLIDSDTHISVVQQVGYKNLDPLGINSVGFNGNPILYYRLRRAERIALEREELDAEQKSIAYKVQQLNLELKGEKNAKLEQSLEYYENLLVEIRAKIKAIDEKAGITNEDGY